MRRLLTFFFLILAGTCCQAQVKQYDIRVIREYPHDRKAYTQGLFFHGDTLYESTGGWGSSSLRKTDLHSGKTLSSVTFHKQYFGEGSCILDGKLYVLTWTNKQAFIYDPTTLKHLQTYRYPRQGWGLTTDGKSLIASDGSSTLYFMTPTFQTERTVDVRLQGKSVRLLNELEWIDGKIWANVYTTDSIFIINPADGRVEGIVHCNKLLPDSLRTQDTDVLNGIACLGDRIFLTGKNWPVLYEVRLVVRK